jgi:sugar lactone lactonase YvrE
MTRRILIVPAIAAILVLLLLSGLPIGAHSATTAASAPRDEQVAIAPSLSPPNPFWTGMPASVALGAPNFTTEWTTPNASAFGGYPVYAVMDSSGNIWVADFDGNRVLEFQPPFTTGEKAELVLGQSDFTSIAANTTATNMSGPTGLAFDSHGDLWVAQKSDNRVVEFRPPFSTGMAASLVIGQSNFAGFQAGITAHNISGPLGISIDSAGDLWVAELRNNRVTEFVPPFSDGMAASVVIGQSVFTANVGATTSTNLSAPCEAEVSNGVLWVADESGNRVVGYPAPFSTGEAADIVLGQSSFTTSTATGEAAFTGPDAVWSDHSGDLWVSDQDDSRMLEFTPPFSDFQNPTVAIGQASLTTIGPNLTATGLYDPYGAFISPAGDLWVDDGGNSRILEYIPTAYTLALTPTGLPAGTPWTALVNGQNVTGTGALHLTLVNGTYALQVPPVAGLRADPAFEQFNVDGSPVDLSVSFSPAAPNPFSTGMPASLVLGQPNFNSALSSGGSTLNGTDINRDWTAAFDASGDLWVADEDFNRVLEFRPPFTNDMAASIVLGQSSFSGDHLGNTSTNLSGPNGIAFDASGDLWVSDSSNNRVVEFVPPFTTGMAATLVIGQTAFGTNTAGHGPSQLHYPFGLEFSHGNLWVTDTYNNRVLEYTAPFSNGEAATSVLGQSNLSGYFPGLSATNLSDAAYLAFNPAGDLWVSDYGNSRVIEFPSPLTTGEAATVVEGQANLTLNNATGPTSLALAGGIWIDGHGNLWVADHDHNRVLEYSGARPLVTNQTPVLVIGQGNLNTTGSNTTRTGLYEPTDVLGDSHGDLWVVDDDNWRILEYAPTSFLLKFTESGLPSSTPWGVAVNGTALAGSGSIANTTEENGTYSWTADAVPGWSVSPSSGNFTVNGGPVDLTVAYTQITYAVTFQEVGLPAGTNWSVTVGGVLHSGSGSSIVLSEPNGSYAYTVGAVTGYSESNGTGTVTVDAAASSYEIVFTSTSAPPSSSPAGLTTTDLILLLVVVIVIVAVVLLIVTRRKKGTTPPPTPWTPPAPGAAGPPPGAMGAPPGPPPPPPPA